MAENIGDLRLPEAVEWTARGQQAWDASDNAPAMIAILGYSAPRTAVGLLVEPLAPLVARIRRYPMIGRGYREIVAWLGGGATADDVRRACDPLSDSQRFTRGEFAGTVSFAVWSTGCVVAPRTAWERGSGYGALSCIADLGSGARPYPRSPSRGWVDAVVEKRSGIYEEFVRKIRAASPVAPGLAFSQQS